LNNTSFSYTTTVPFNFTVTGGGNSFSGFFVETNFVLLPSRNFGFEDVRVTRNGNFQYTQTGFKQVTNIIYVGSKRIPREVTNTVAWSRTATGTFSFRDTVTRETTFNFFVLAPVNIIREFSGTNAVWSYTERGTTTNTVFVPAFSYIDFAPYTYTVIVPARTVTDQKVSLRQSIEGNLNLIESWVVSSVETIRSLRVRLQGREITTRAYSDPNLVSQIGDQLVYTATGAEITAKFGLTLAPSPLAQGSTAASTIDIRTS
jgi:hypothetical protein